MWKKLIRLRGQIEGILHPKGPANSFQYLSKPDVLEVPFCDILSEADMSTATGRNYRLKKASQNEATKILRSRMQSCMVINQIYIVF